MVQRTGQAAGMGTGRDRRGFRSEPDGYQSIEHAQRSVFVQQRKQNGNNHRATRPARCRNQIRLVRQLAERRAQSEPPARGPQLFQVRRTVVRGQIRVRARSTVRPVRHTAGRPGRARVSAVRRHGICRTTENTRMHLGDTRSRGPGFVVTF